MAKKVRISVDNGVTFTTIPGHSAELVSDAGDIDDTIFGQDYKSTQTGLINWHVNSNGIYKGFAGYVATIKALGTPTTMTAEPMANLSGNIYQVTNAVKQSIDIGNSVTFYGNGVAINPTNIASINYLFGIVTFVAPPATPVTVTGKYLPSTTIARANGFTLTQTTNAVDDTDFETAQANNGTHTFKAGLKTVSLTLNGIFSQTNSWREQLGSRATILVEINPDGGGHSRARGYFKYTSVGQSGNVGEQEAATATMPLQVIDNSLMQTPFAWLHDTQTTLNLSLQQATIAWQTNTLVDVQYLYDGTNGYQGDALITDLSLAGGLEVMNEFTVNFQGSGELSPVP